MSVVLLYCLGIRSQINFRLQASSRLVCYDDPNTYASGQDNRTRIVRLVLLPIFWSVRRIASTFKTAQKFSLFYRSKRDQELLAFSIILFRQISNTLSISLKPVDVSIVSRLPRKSSFPFGVHSPLQPRFMFCFSTVHCF
ncbi:MAG: hypothetical protein DME86_01235 [Verrucomicrobia bacterium]|nr:MAG: hypothetical protein DME86_01235 [Verrucomicrobiota bacterium]